MLAELCAEFGNGCALMPGFKPRRIGPGWRLAVAAGIASAAALSGKEAKMDPYIPLYQYVHEGDRIAVARISHLEIKPSAHDGMESITLDFRVEEELATPGHPAAYHYVFDRSTNAGARIKRPDPIWARVTLRTGTQVLLVTSALAVPPPGERNPIYAEDIPGPDDPVLRAIRDILHGERAHQTDAERFDRRLRWLASADVVQRLYAGEALAKDDRPAEPPRTLLRTFAHAFLVERDEYTAMSLGAWLWENLYPRVTSEDGRIVILNATLAAASSDSRYVRNFVVDHLAASDLNLLRKPGIQPSAEAVSLLEQRLAQETDAGVKERTSRVIDALHR
jgi:hypothetical protein